MGNAVAVGYAVVGIVVSLVGAVFALSRARAARSFYAADVYHMTARTHLRFAGLSAVFTAAFVAALRLAGLTVPLLAVYALLLVLYASSFARGFSDDD
jgi:predicted Co/Zn/Cd cation transporter (cation efflux family)